MNERPKRRFIVIAFGIVLMASSIFVIGESLVETLAEGTEEGEVLESATSSRLASEVSGFERGDVALSYLKATKEGGRTLASFYALRAYEGAPPFIPHEIEEDRDMGGEHCLTCHENGGYAPKFNAYTPVTPHPDLINCRQCHNPGRVDGTFKGSTFVPIEKPSLNATALSGSPPAIPHQLRMRENCLACHAGPGAAKEIRTTHPERINCRQCHAVTSEDKLIWRRPGGDKLP